MGRPRQVTDEQIIAIARRVFLRRGPHAPVSAIAKELGVSHTAIFARFGTKKRLLLSAFAPPEVLPFANVIRRGPDERDVRVQLRELAALFVGYFTQTGQGWAMLQAAGIGVDSVFEGRGQPSPLAAQRLLARWVRKAIARRLLAVDDPAVFSWTFLGALHLRVFQVSLLGRTALESEFDRFVELILEGARP